MDVSFRRPSSPTQILALANAVLTWAQICLLKRDIYFPKIKNNNKKDFIHYVGNIKQKIWYFTINIREDIYIYLVCSFGGFGNCEYTTEKVIVSKCGWQLKNVWVVAWVLSSFSDISYGWFYVFVHFCSCT